MKVNVKNIAKLANLSLEETEEKTIEKDLEETISYIEKLNEIDTTNINPTSQVTGLENVLREDIEKKSLTQKEALQNAKHTHNGFIEVPAILEE